MASSKSNSNDDVKDEKVTNPYLAMREAKIARNQKRLSELGLLKPPPPQKLQPMLKKPQQRNVPVRRSSRLSSQEKQPRKRTRNAPKVASSPVPRKTRSNEAIKSKEPPPAAALAVAPAADSVRSVSLDVDYLVLGHNEDHRDGLLGKIVARPGKDYVIHKSFAKAAHLEDRDRLKGENTKLSFNKYSGVQEWKVRLACSFHWIKIAHPRIMFSSYDTHSFCMHTITTDIVQNCIFLWVNLGNSDSPNEFLENGSSITWYGGSRMHESSPIFLKLIANDHDSNIILWCRRYTPETKTLSPYVCFGRLKYRSHEHGSYPLKFVWDLDDYYDLLLHADFARVQTFNLFKEPL